MALIGNQNALAYTSFAKQDFTVTATTSYTLDHSVSNENEIALFINFVRQEPTTAYTCSGNQLTLTEATSVGDDMYCVFIGKAVQTVTPANGTVTNSMLASGSFSNITDVGTLSSGLTVSDNILFDTASKGIYLGVTTPTASNLLDDYEEGDWTPTLGSYSGTPTINNAHYIKIGKLVMASARIVLDGTSDTSIFEINGLPFTCKSTTNDVFGGIISFADTSLTAFFNFLVNRNTTDAYLYQEDGSAVTYNEFGNNGTIRFNLVYQTTS